MIGLKQKARRLSGLAKSSRTIHAKYTKNVSKKIKLQTIMGWASF